MKTTHHIKFVILLLTLVGISATSCKKFLDTVPKELTLETYFNTPIEASTYLNSIYDAMNRVDGIQAFYSGNYESFFSQGSDESYNRSIPVAGSIAHFNANSTDVQNLGVWRLCYTGIGRANTFLENVDKVEGFTGNQKKHMIGEAKFLRAYYHFIVTQWWGDCPLRTKSITVPQDTHIAFTKSKDVYDWVIQEMTEAEALLSTQKATNIVPYNSGRVVQTTVQGILARVCLYAAGEPINDTKRYAEARGWADKVIKSGIHNLNPDYAQIFINQCADAYDVTYKESMWECEFSVIAQGGVLRENHSNTIQQPNGNLATGQVNPTPVLYRSFQSYYNPIRSTDNSPDYRRDISISNFAYSGSGPSLVKVFFTFNQNGYWVRWPNKWNRDYEVVVPRDNNNSPMNVGLLRYSDVLLMFVEADFKSTGVVSPEAISIMNLIRSRAYGGLNNPVKNGIELTLTANQGSGYTVAPTAITQIGATGTEDATIGTTIVGGKVTSLIMSTTGKYSDVPLGTIVYLGTPWTPNTAFAVNANIVVPTTGNLYRVTTAGTSTTIAPFNTSGASTAATTGAVFTYIGTAATATAKKLTGALTPADYDPANFLKTIQDERMRELCFEMLRKQDLKRWGLLKAKVIERADLALNGSTERFPNNVQIIPPAPSANRDAARADGINFTDKWLVYPIPAVEMNLNKFAKQNPGF
ncbi:RagB/SusD family nutrient uptake outer membrane protein [Pedobacter frigiditerrae]|nr:RagB/SusD family nutrient uptake outer membrane protein [Pedobacter frigiditerrae]